MHNTTKSPQHNAWLILLCCANFVVLCTTGPAQQCYEGVYCWLDFIHKLQEVSVYRFIGLWLLTEASSDSAGFLNEKYSKIVILFVFEYILKYNLFLWWQSSISSSITQSSVSFDPSKITLLCWFAAQEKNMIYALNSCKKIYINIKYV